MFFLWQGKDVKIFLILPVTIILGHIYMLPQNNLKNLSVEFTFRLNEGNVAIDTIDRIKNLCFASQGKRLKYSELTK